MGVGITHILKLLCNLPGVIIEKFCTVAVKYYTCWYVYHGPLYIRQWSSIIQATSMVIEDVYYYSYVQIAVRLQANDI